MLSTLYSVVWSVLYLLCIRGGTVIGCLCVWFLFGLFLENDMHTPSKVAKLRTETCAKTIYFHFFVEQNIHFRFLVLQIFPRKM